MAVNYHLTKIMAQNETNKMWEAKEKREMLRTLINTMVMRVSEGKLPEIDPIYQTAKWVVDKAFEDYPAPEEEGQVNLEFK